MDGEPVQDRTTLLNPICEHCMRTQAIEASCARFACLPLFSEYMAITNMYFRVVNKVRNSLGL